MEAFVFCIADAHQGMSSARHLGGAASLDHSFDMASPTSCSRRLVVLLRMSRQRRGFSCFPAPLCMLGRFGHKHQGNLECCLPQHFGTAVSPAFQALLGIDL